MTKSLVLRAAAAAVVAGFLLPAASFAQSGDRTAPSAQPYGQPASCTQLERSAGVPTDKCGQLTLAEIAHLKGDRDNTN